MSFTRVTPFAPPTPKALIAPEASASPAVDPDVARGEPAHVGSAERRSAATLAVMSRRKSLPPRDIDILRTVFELPPEKALAAIEPHITTNVADGTTLDALCHVPLAYLTPADTLRAITALDTKPALVRLALFHLHRDPLTPAGTDPGALLAATARATAPSHDNAVPAEIYADAREVLAWYASEAEPEVWTAFAADCGRASISGADMEKIRMRIAQGQFGGLPRACAPTVDALQALATVRARINGAAMIGTAKCAAVYDPDDPFHVPVGSDSALGAKHEPYETLFALVRDSVRDEVVLGHFTQGRERWLGPRFSSETAARVFAMFEYGIPENGWRRAPETSGG